MPYRPLLRGVQILESTLKWATWATLIRAHFLTGNASFPSPALRALPSLPANGAQRFARILDTFRAGSTAADSSG